MALAALPSRKASEAVTCHGVMTGLAGLRGETLV